MDKSRQYLFSSDQRKALLSLFDQFDDNNNGNPSFIRPSPVDIDYRDELVENDDTELRETNSAAESASSSTITSTDSSRKLRKLEDQGLSIGTTNSSWRVPPSKAAGCATASSSSFRVSSWRPDMSVQCQPQPPQPTTPQLMDALSFNSSVRPQSAVDSVSTLQATEIAAQPVSASKAAIGASHELNYSTVTDDGLDTSDTPCPRKRRRKRGGKGNKIRQFQPQQQKKQATLKAEQFSQYLRPGLSTEDDEDSLQYLLRTPHSRSFWIRSDQRKDYQEQELLARRREMPIRSNRTTQLRLQRLETARNQQRLRAIRLTKQLSESRQNQLRQQRQQKLQAEQRDRERRRKAEEDALQAERERNDMRRRALALQRQQRNRSALGVPSSSSTRSRNTTLTSPSGSRTQDNCTDHDAETTVSLATVTMPLDKDEEEVRSAKARLFKYKDNASTQWQTWRKQQQKQQKQQQQLRYSSQATRASDMYDRGSDNILEDRESLSGFGSGDVAAASPSPKIRQETRLPKEEVEKQNQEKQQQQRKVQQNIFNAKLGGTFRINLTREKPQQERRPRAEHYQQQQLAITDETQGQSEQLQQTQQKQQQQRQEAGQHEQENKRSESQEQPTFVEETQKSPFDRQATVDSEETLQRRAIALERLREEFLQGVETRLFGTGDQLEIGDSNEPAAPSAAIAAVDELSSLGGQLFAEFSELKSDLARLLDVKRQALNANVEAGQLAENQRQLNAKVQQLDSLIKRVMQHIDNGGSSNSGGGCSGITEATDPASVEQRKYAELISFDTSANAVASELSPSRYPPAAPAEQLCQQHQPRLSPCNATNEIYRKIDPPCRHCAAPVHNCTMSSSEAGPHAVNLHDKSISSIQNSFPSAVRDSSYESEHARRIVAQLRKQLDIMRRASEGLWQPPRLEDQEPEHQAPQHKLQPRFKSLGDPIGTIEHRRRVSRQRAVERDPSQARLLPVVLRHRKWRPGSPKFQAFASNRCNWCKRYRESVLPLWTNAIRAELSFDEPIGDSLRLLGSRLGKPLSPDWVLSTAAFPDDGCPGHASILDLTQTPHQAGLKPWQTIFVSEDNTSQMLAETAAAATVAAAAPHSVAATVTAGVAVTSAAPATGPSTRVSELGTLLADDKQRTSLSSPPKTVAAVQTQTQTPPTVSSTPTMSAGEEAGTLTVLPPRLARVCEQSRVTLTTRAAAQQPEPLPVTAKANNGVEKSISASSCHSCQQCVCRQPQLQPMAPPAFVKGDIYGDTFARSPTTAPKSADGRDLRTFQTGDGGDCGLPASGQRRSPTAKPAQSPYTLPPSNPSNRENQLINAANIHGDFNLERKKSSPMPSPSQVGRNSPSACWHYRPGIYSFVSSSDACLSGATNDSSAAVSIQSSVKLNKQPEQQCQLHARDDMLSTSTGLGNY